MAFNQRNIMRTSGDVGHVTHTNIIESLALSNITLVRCQTPTSMKEFTSLTSTTRSTGSQTVERQGFRSTKKFAYVTEVIDNISFVEYRSHRSFIVNTYSLQVMQKEACLNILELPVTI